MAEADNRTEVRLNDDGSIDSGAALHREPLRLRHGELTSGTSGSIGNPVPSSEENIAFDIFRRHVLVVQQ